MIRVNTKPHHYRNQVTEVLHYVTERYVSGGGVSNDAIQPVVGPSFHYHLPQPAVPQKAVLGTYRRKLYATPFTVRGSSVDMTKNRGQTEVTGGRQ